MWRSTLIGPGQQRPCLSRSWEGVIFQEVLTIVGGPEKLAKASQSLEEAKAVFGSSVYLNPHAPWTVHHETLQWLAKESERISIHVAESVHENEYFKDSKGPIAAACEKFGITHPHARSAVEYLDSVSLLRSGVQLVHACDVDSEDIELMAEKQVSVAHCPRSNEALDCPRAPIREMLDAGIQIGLGLDSVATSGPIDFFAEMRAAIKVSEARGAPVTPEEVWRMATTMGASSLGRDHWEIKPGGNPPLIAIYAESAHHIEDVILEGAPKQVDWLDL